jgi:imidazole glycerol-phosphate synthase subunit HisH
MEQGNYIAIIKYNAGNVQSVLYALQRLGVAALVTDDVAQIQSAAKVIFPGVGHAAPAMQYLKQRGLDAVIKQLQQPVLGICLGQQLLCRYSEEGDTECLGIFDEPVQLFRPSGNFARLKVPHMGWNSIAHLKTSLFAGVSEMANVYAVHSYFTAVGADTIATSQFINPFSAALQKNNFYAVQFHPEKSAAVGETILKNFIDL